MGNNLLTISQAAELLGVSIDTLRRWSLKGVVRTSRSIGGHRYYEKNDIIDYLKNIDIYKAAKDWVNSLSLDEPQSFFYCSDAYVFQVRLSRMESELMKMKKYKEKYSLIVAVIGEIGNNSFDHNIGNWPDVRGIFFGYNLQSGIIVLADRGRGVLKTLKKIKPELKNDKEAINTAFTEIISGRSPENRGNGLKFTKSIIMHHDFGINFQSGNAVLKISKEGEKKIDILTIKKSIKGCLVQMNI